MNRREFLTTTASTSLPLVAGCSALAGEDGALTYALEIEGPIEESAADADPSTEVLDYDTTGMAMSQREIVAEAVRTGSYSEENVTWETLPGREAITMDFRMLLQLLARHVDRDPEIDRPTSFETPSRYEKTPYRTVVTAE